MLSSNTKTTIGVLVAIVVVAGFVNESQKFNYIKSEIVLLAEECRVAMTELKFENENTEIICDRAFTLESLAQQ